ncbi:DUF515 domain-containing protein [Methanobrevibacter millerae]|uniref:DUF515 domain-containing protein n=1 Tax=Methanobrevibacter millerae TaxID=230361 RepID=A0A1G5VCE3_9EURY|nr:DUF515 domain-containing protein [Methanobrevibacter millerae]SDA42705.1 Protein of unknown function [Methanobrevibacter millerae]
MEKKDNPLFPNGLNEMEDLKKKEIPRPRHKKVEKPTAIEAFNEKLGKIFNFNKAFDVGDEKKRKIGIIITTLIILTLILSAYYFLIYEPAQEELDAARTSKLNELHELYKGPLASAGNVFAIEDKINEANNAHEVESIDVLKLATSDWKKFHLQSIRTNTDKFNRTMAVWENSSKSVVMSADEAVNIVNSNDALKLSEMIFKKPDTVSVPILISRLQAGAGLISVGSIVDIYKNESSDFNETSLNNTDADVSGCTVLSIMRYDDSGEIDAQYSKSDTKVSGNTTNPTEDTQAFSSNVLEMLKGAIAKGYDEETTLEMLRDYGVKLSSYERQINLGDLDAEYMVLLEVPHEKVNFIINNMDSIVLTIPTANAPSWMEGQLTSTYQNG